MDFVKIVGSAEGTEWLARVPCVGETVRLHGLPRRVTAVEHLPRARSLPLTWTLAEVTECPQEPVAVVVVADE